MAVEPSHRYEYDVFVSYTRILSRWVKALFLPTLENLFYTGSIFADPDIEPGANWRSELRDAHRA
jgi:hypothetical protein